MHKKSKNRMIICLGLIVFMLSFSFFTSLFTSNYNFDNDVDLEISDITSDYLYNGVSYPFMLGDVYDDENSTKIYTDAYLQTEYFNETTLAWNETVVEDQISVVNNTEHANPEPSDITMIEGNYDSSDNMDSLDSTYSDFDTDSYAPPTEGETVHISSLSFTYGSIFSGIASDTHNDDANRYIIKSADNGPSNAIDFALNLDSAPAGRHFYISYDIETNVANPDAFSIKINGEIWKSTGGKLLDADDQYCEGVNTVEIYAEFSDFTFYMYFYYWEMVESITTDGELDFTVDSSLANYDDDGLLSLSITSYHKTDVSTSITVEIWNYDTTSYENLFESTSTSIQKNHKNFTANLEDYFDGNGNLKIKYTGACPTSDFELNIDYLEFRITYKMDVIIYKSFYINGIYRYRFKLIGSLHYTDWTVFEVIDPIPNFYAISESDLTTRWILQNASLTAVEDFHDDINTDYWNLVDVSSVSFTTTSTSTDDSYVRYIDYPDTNYGAEGYMWVDGDTTGYPGLRRAYVGFDTLSHLYSNATTDLSHLYLYLAYTNTYTSNLVDCYNTTASFEEDTITWNNQPDEDDYLDQEQIVSISPQWYSWDISHHSSLYFRIRHTTEGSAINKITKWYTKDAGSYLPYFTKNVYKNYFGDGYMYMQTDTTESIGLQSKDYGAHKTLSSGDYFEVDFQTSSDSKIELILLKDGDVNKTLTLSGSGNTNFGKHTAKISVDESVEFDQLKISSTFEDTDNVIIYGVKTYKYTLTGDHADFYVGSKRDREVYLTPNIYNLRITEEGDEKVNTNITIPATGVLQYLYTPIERLECRLTLFNTEGSHLDFMDYHIKVNRSLNDVYNMLWLLDSIFTADTDTYAYISIYDRFDTLIDTFERLTSEYIDLEIEVYSLQIKNLMTQKTTLDVNSSYTYPLLSGDSIYFMLSKEYYQIGYYDTNDVYKQFSIYLDSNQAYELNRSRICFLSYADQQGNHLSFDNYKTYINGSLIYENVFYREIGDIVGIEIKDRYGISIKNDTYTVISGDNYIPITLTMYSLKIMNQQEIFNWINITRDPNYYESEMYWSEWIAPTEIIEFKLFAGYYKINLSDNENSGSSYYSYTLNGDDVLLISSGNTISNLIINIANVNVTLGNQITNVQIDLTNQNSEINNTIINIEINLSNVNSSLGNLLVDLNLGITNIANNISSLYVFTNNSFLNLDNQINNSFIYMEDNIISINQSISTLVIGLDGKISIVNATINTMWTEMSNQFIVVQSTLDFSFAFLNQTIVQIGNNITTNQIALNNLIVQRANEIDNSLIQISTLVNLINSSVVNESLVIQTLVNLIGNNITENHIAINDLINLIGNNITENNVIMTNLIELVGNNITTNQFVIQTLIDYVSNNITDNHLELLTNINFINNTIDQNQIELINRLLFINNSINDMAIDLTNQILLVNNTIYSAILDVSTFINFTSDNILGNITLTYQQNDFLTELYKETMFSSLLNWSDVAFNYSIMEDRIDVWEFVNNFEDDAIIVHLRYQDLIDNLTVSAQNTIEQYLPNEDVEYRLWSIANEEYLDEWQPLLPENKTVILGYFKLECRLSLLNTEGIHLEFTDYYININRSLNGVYNDSWILDSIFSVDKGTYVYISVYDRFNTSINTFEILITLPYIDLELEVYSLQIKSLLEIATTLTVNSTHVYPLLSGDSKYFTLLKAYYQIEYYDDNNVFQQFTIYLGSNQAYELNSTYFDIYFSIFNFDGLGLNRDLVRFYINGVRRDFGFNVLKQDVNNLKVLDFFNATIFDQNVNLGHCTEYNVLVEIYTLIINNNYTRSIRIEIERDNSNIVVIQIIPAQYGMPYRFLPDIEYIITAYDLNGTKLDVKYVELDKNNKIVNFGFYSTEVPITPRPLEADILTFVAFIVIICVFGWILVIAWAYIKKDRDVVPEDTQLIHKRKRQASIDRRKGFYDHT